MSEAQEETTPVSQGSASVVEVLSRADSVGSSLALEVTAPQSPALATTQSSLILSDNRSETSTLATGGGVSPPGVPRGEDRPKREREASDDAPAAKTLRVDDAVQARKVYVSNLDFRTTKEDLAEFFEQWGTVESVVVPVHPHSVRSRGFAFVTFADPDAAETAIAEMNGKEYDGRVLTVTRPEVKIAQCKFFHSPGGCYNGAKCRFAHVGDGNVAVPPRAPMGPPPFRPISYPYRVSFAAQPLYFPQPFVPPAAEPAWPAFSAFQQQHHAPRNNNARPDHPRYAATNDAPAEPSAADLRQHYAVPRSHQVTTPYHAAPWS